MGTKLVQARLDERICILIDPNRKRAILEQALVAFLKLDPATLTPIVTTYQAKPSGHNLPKTYSACKDDDERIAYMEEIKGAVLGGNPDWPDLWLLSDGMLWHYDKDRSWQANIANGKSLAAANIVPTGDSPDGKTVISQARWDGYMASAKGRASVIAQLEHKYMVETPQPVDTRERVAQYQWDELYADCWDGEPDMTVDEATTWMNERYVIE